VVSVVSGLPLRKVSELVSPATHISRAVPLPSTAQRRGPTAIYPSDSSVADLFAAIGTVFEVDSEAELEAISAATATIAFSYEFIEAISFWLSRNGVPESKARGYIARMFFGLTSAAVDVPEKSFRSLANHHATVGGINEQFLKHMTEHSLRETISSGLDAVLQRIRVASRECDARRP
jgi:pyrroline-5-carboxylate reductase